jgi:hypothetical protein
MGDGQSKTFVVENLRAMTTWIAKRIVMPTKQ